MMAKRTIRGADFLRAVRRGRKAMAIINRADKTVRTYRAARDGAAAAKRTADRAQRAAILVEHVVEKVGGQ